MEIVDLIYVPPPSPCCETLGGDVVSERCIQNGVIYRFVSALWVAMLLSHRPPVAVIGTPTVIVTSETQVGGASLILMSSSFFCQHIVDDDGVMSASSI